MITAGVARISGSAARSDPRPCGRTSSRTAQSKERCRIAAAAVAPQGAVITDQPSSSRKVPSARATASESSASRMRPTAQLEGDRDAVLARLDHQPNGTFQDRRDALDIDGPQAVERLIMEPARLALPRFREAVPDAFPEEAPSLARPEALSGPIDEAEAPLTIED